VYSLKPITHDSTFQALKRFNEKTAQSMADCAVFSFLHPRRESNPHLKNRNLTCYPLHYEGKYCSRLFYYTKAFPLFQAAIFNSLDLTFIDHDVYDECTAERCFSSTYIYPKEEIIHEFNPYSNRTDKQRRTRIRYLFPSIERPCHHARQRDR